MSCPLKRGERVGKYKIMTFDGGGVRGVLAATLLERLENRFPELVRSVDLFAGTSAGSFIALSLAYGLPASRIAELFSEESGKFIFTPRYLELFRPKYNNDHLKKMLYSVFPPELRLRDLPKQVLVTSFRVTANHTGRWGPVFFTNFPGSPTSDEKVIDVALYSSAAPVYFPSHQGHIDGGVVANNPCTAALCAAVDRWMGGCSLENVCLLSFGTGSSRQSINADTSGWGALEWMFYPYPSFPLMSILFDGSVAADTLYCSQLLGNRFFRLDVTSPVNSGLDDYEKVSELVEKAKNTDLGPVVEWVKSNWL